MPDLVQQITEQVKRIAEQAAARTGVRIGTVLGRNPDGTYIVDDGQGGCARVENITNQPVQCGSQVVLGVEPQIGQTLTVCPVSVTVSSSTKPCPIDDRTDDNEVEVAVVVSFTDDAGNIYDPTGALTGSGGDPAAVDPAYGYFFDAGDNSCWVGVSPSYHDLKIGDLDDDSGNQGESYFSQATVLCLNTISGVLLGAELKNSGTGGHDDDWRLVKRDPTTFAIIGAQSMAAFLNDWINAHPTSFFGDPPYTFAVHITPDPVDGNFWVNAESAVPPDKMAIFKVSSDDLSLLATVELAVPDQFRRRAKGVVL